LIEFGQHFCIGSMFQSWGFILIFSWQFREFRFSLMLTYACRSENILLFCQKHLLCNFETVSEHWQAEKWLLGRKKSLDFYPFDFQPKIISVFLAIIAKLRFLPTFLCRTFLVWGVWLYEWKQLILLSNTWKPGFPGILLLCFQLWTIRNHFTASYQGLWLTVQILFLKPFNSNPLFIPDTLFSPVSVIKQTQGSKPK